MDFPFIRTIEDVRASAQAAGECFTWRDTHGGRLRSIAYSVVPSSAVFSAPLAREFRGLAFDAETGEIASRPIHKFFNWGERPEADRDIDWSAPHRVVDKLDGTLMHLAKLSDGEVIWCTKGGATDVAERLTALMPDPVRRAAQELLESPSGMALTPCFEFIGPSNRIVLRYPENELRLLCLRERVSGRYLDGDAVENMLRQAQERTGVRLATADGVVGARSEWRFADLEKRIDGVRDGGPEMEGVVIAFDSGERLKLKTSAYVSMHRCVSGLLSEKILLQAVCDDDVDDWAGLLDAVDFAAVMHYADGVRQAMQTHAQLIRRMVGDLLRQYGDDGKGFALAWQDAAPSDLHKTMGFAARKHALNGGCLDLDFCRDLVRDAMLRCARRSVRVREIAAPAFGLPDWKWSRFGIGEE